MTRIVVTGALGHIGSRLIRRLPELLPEAPELVLIDNLATQRFGSLFDLPRGGRVRFHQADVCRAGLADLFAGSDAVIHLAALTDAAASHGRAEAVKANNLLGTRRVAEAAAEAGAGLIFLSTTSVYGSQSQRVDEACPASELKPQSPYAEVKLAEEALLTELAASQGLTHLTLRFGTIFGVSPGMRFHTAVNRFCWQAAMGKPLSVWRTARNQLRPYLDLEDAVAALAFLVARGVYDGQLLNVVTLNTSVGSIVEKLAGLVPDLRVEEVDSPIMNQLSYEVAAERIRERARARGVGAIHRGRAQPRTSRALGSARASNGRAARCAASNRGAIARRQRLG